LQPGGPAEAASSGAPPHRVAALREWIDRLRSPGSDLNGMAALMGQVLRCMPRWPQARALVISDRSRPESPIFSDLGGQPRAAYVMVQGDQAWGCESLLHLEAAEPAGHRGPDAFFEAVLDALGEEDRSTLLNNSAGAEGATPAERLRAAVCEFLQHELDSSHAAHGSGLVRHLAHSGLPALDPPSPAPRAEQLASRGRVEAWLAAHEAAALERPLFARSPAASRQDSLDVDPEWARLVEQRSAAAQALPHLMDLDALTVPDSELDQYLPIKAARATADAPALPNALPPASAPQALRAEWPRQPLETAPAWARRIHQDDARVRALPYEQRIGVLARATGVTERHLRQEPALRDKTGEEAERAQAVQLRWPRQPREGLLPWARRIHRSDESVQSLPYEQRIALLASATGAKATELRQEPALLDKTGELAEWAQALQAQWPQQTGEGCTVWARRIHRSDAWVQALPYEQRIAVLSRTTGATEGILRNEPALRDLVGELAEWARALQAQWPQRPQETAIAWARRLHESDGWLQSLPYEYRIAVLSRTTEVTETNLRKEPALRDKTSEEAEWVQALRARWPRLPKERVRTWAQRIYREDPRLQAMPYEPRLKLLALATGATQGKLRQDPVLRGERASSSAADGVQAPGLSALGKSA
jgi:hypothetical protein